jgi:CelD/BcsL family acetyltransferase involved in cellulose biosynthesis
LGFAEFLVDHVDAAGFDFRLDQEETTAVLPLPTEWDNYVEHLDKKERHELRRKRRRLGRDHPDATFRTATPETLKEDLESFIEMHKQAEGHKGRFMGPHIVEFFHRIADCFMPPGWLHLDLLEVAGKPVAATFSFQLDNVFYLYNSAYEPAVARLSPGYILVSRLIEDAIEGGVKQFDFLRGPERYKYQFGARPLPLNNVRVLRKA